MLSILPNHFKQLPENKSDNFLIFSHSKYVAKVTLNRPKALNAVNQDMIKSLDLELEKWNSAPNLKVKFFLLNFFYILFFLPLILSKVVIFTGNGGKAFCAGGELKTTYEAKKNSNMDFILSYYREMFTLFYRTSLMKPIQIAFWDGIVIGAGAGLSLNAPIKIATEFTAFSMPGKLPFSLLK